MCESGFESILRKERKLERFWYEWQSEIHMMQIVLLY